MIFVRLCLRYTWFPFGVQVTTLSWQKIKTKSHATKLTTTGRAATCRWNLLRRKEANCNRKAKLACIYPEQFGIWIADTGIWIGKRKGENGYIPAKVNFWVWTPNESRELERIVNSLFILYSILCLKTIRCSAVLKFWKELYILSSIE